MEKNMNKIALTVGAALLCHLPAPVTASQPKALVVVSSHGRDGGKTQPGFEMDELSQAWLLLSANGYDVKIASPEGGAVVADEFDATKPYNSAFLATAKAKVQLESTQRLTTAMGRSHDIVMIIGGKGAMFDLPISQALQQIVVDQLGRGGVVAAVCHGPAVFANIVDKDGKHFTAGKSLTGFTNEEEQMFGKKWVKHFPFLIETRFAEQGARFGEAPIMLPHVAVDGRVVTGQNPYSVAAATEAAIKADGRKPKARTMWPDERATHLLSLVSGGNTAPLAEAIATDPTSVDIPLVASWSYYRAKQLPDNPEVLGQSIKTMRMTSPHMKGPQFGQALAELEKQYSALCPGGQCPTTPPSR
jgi:putative intracellular protease/amidase